MAQKPLLQQISKLHSEKPFKLIKLLVVAAAFTMIPSSVLAQNTPSNPDHKQAPYEHLWTRRNTGLNRTSSPVIADIDNDQQNEIVFGHQDGILRAYEDGGILKWRAKAVPSRDAAGLCKSQNTPSSINSSPTVADIDNDGEAEILVGVGSISNPSQNGSLIAFDGATGIIEWSFEYNRDNGYFSSQRYSRTPDGWCEAIYTTPAVGDVDGDDNLDVVFAGVDFQIWAVDNTGQPLVGFPFESRDSVFSSPALFDVDDDDDVEIFIGGDSTHYDGKGYNGGIFQAIDYKNRQPVELWSRPTNEVFRSSPTIADINNDGRFEAVVGMGRKWHEQCGGDRQEEICKSKTAGNQHNQVWAFHLDDGSDTPGWPVRATDSVVASPAIGDVDADGLLEVVVGSYDRQLYVWNGDGNVQWSSEPQFPHSEWTNARLTGSPVIADLDSDGKQDIIVATEVGVAFLDGQDGSALDRGLPWQQLAGFGLSYETAPAIGQVGDKRLLIVSGYNKSRDFTLTQAYALPQTVTRDAWPMFRYGAERQGTASVYSDGHGIAERYIDIEDAGVHRSGIQALLQKGILTRTECHQGFFCSDSPVKRWVMAVWIIRALGEDVEAQPAQQESQPNFIDVDPDEWWAPYVVRLAELEVTKGCSTTARLYCPEHSVTRAQMATFLKRAFDLSDAESVLGFTDISGNTHESNINRLAHAGITGGCLTTPLRFCPDRSTSRGQMSTFIARVLGLVDLPR
ncbi:MAG: FG-GAP-like repeat-containing protein [Acidimicrobiaceae bacterium]|nr:FG-GAP-like repeat-containing protein [Acidimicrobiaceae bacterium]